MQKESEFADRKAHLSPPIYITDWLETEILRREAGSLIADRRLGNIVLIDRTAVAGSEYRLPLGAIDLRRNQSRLARGISCSRGAVSEEIAVRRRAIRPDEYGAPLAIDFTGDVNPGRLFQASKPVTDPRV